MAVQEQITGSKTLDMTLRNMATAFWLGNPNDYEYTLLLCANRHNVELSPA